ncbi:MAG: PAS domain-containing protein [Rhizobiales bacterium]|nr:PAS domain-containing protein [Hyphomicrobiales bacterium]
MPDALRATCGSIRTQPRRRGFRSGLAAVLPSAALATRADAAGFGEPFLDTYLHALLSLGRHETVAIALTLGVLCFAVSAAILLVRTRARGARREAAAHDEIISLKVQNDRASALLHSEPQVIVAWAAAADEPEIIGDATLVAPASAPYRVLAFGTWLDAEQASALEHAVDALRSSGAGFAMTLATLAGRPIEAAGRVIGGRAVLRLKDVTGVQRELNELTARHAALVTEVESLRALVDALPAPVWMRDAAGKLTFVNAAYTRAVEAKEGADAIASGTELIERGVREGIARARAARTAFTGRLPAVVAGARRNFDVVEVPTGRGSAGIAVDATEAETLRTELARMVDAHRRTLDQLATGVAIFTADHRLTFYNTAYRLLWDLDPALLDERPTDSAVLDQLRAARKLPEQQDFRQWKAQLHEAYRAVEAEESQWYLPDGRTLRVVTTPNPEGGVTYLFHDVTERLDLQRRYDGLIRVQRETLDNLGEAVAVFGSDGRIRLFNPAFAQMWKLSPTALAERPHIEAVAEWCKPLHHGDVTWAAVRAAVTAIEERDPVAGRVECNDGSVVDCATVPLPDGATLVTFQDITDSVNVERALRERNEALETADRIKIDFVHHVSYELRSPLTNIIGFAHFLGDPSTGPLTGKQHEYLGYINVSTNALLAIINNILDLATIDAGAMTLNLGPVDIRQTMEAAAEGIQDRLVKDGISLDIRVVPDIGSFTADERRVRQILFNLLANAVGFSPPGEAVTLTADRRSDAVVFAVTDRGPGIPTEMKDRVFHWFETHSLGSQHRGTGLGLSLVRSFVELHGGMVRIESAIGTGTTVTCIFPLDHVPVRTAA